MIISYILIIVVSVESACDLECPGLGALYSCGSIVSGEGVNIKCAYVPQGINTYPFHERNCKGNLIIFSIIALFKSKNYRK
jgi:hypothetical protein